MANLFRQEVKDKKMSEVEKQCIEFGELLKNRYISCCNTTDGCWWESEDLDDIRLTTKEIYDRFKAMVIE